MNKIKHQIKKTKEFTKIIGYKKTFLYLYDHFWKKEKERVFTINGISLHIRTNSPDLSVAISSLINDEYSYLNELQPKVIVDCGANIGASSIYFARQFPNAHIYAIEPENSNFELLYKNTKKYKNITLIKAAVWGEAGDKPIINRMTGHYGYTIANTCDSVEEMGQVIRCLTITEIMNKYKINSIDILKLDIEGGEKNVFEKPDNWIYYVSVITVELHDRILEGCSESFFKAVENFSKIEKHGEKMTAFK